MRREGKAFLACLLLAFFFGGLLLKDMFATRAKQREEISRLRLPDIRPSDLLDGRHNFRGKEAAPYTLVEFGDYECPPCRAHQTMLSDVLNQWNGKVKLDFRQMPLTQIHPHAQEAAIAAESARLAGKFWSVHEQLFSSDLTQKAAVGKTLNASGVGLAARAAWVQVVKDQALAKRLGVEATPTFVLVTPAGYVYRLPNLVMVQELVH